MIIIFELIFECLINRLICRPEQFMISPSKNPRLLRYNVRHLASVLFALFENWILDNCVVDKRSPARPVPRLTFNLMGRRT
jgi:hypothetical protein